MTWLLARALLCFDHSMWLWGLNLQRFLDPFTAWGGWILASLFFLPRVAARCESGLSRLGDWLHDARPAPALAAAAGAAVVLLLPDRTWFTGDFLLREGLAETGGFVGNLSQALPIEVFLDYRLPRLVPGGSGFDPNLLNRLVGAACAALIAAAAVAIVRAWNLRGSGAAAASGVILWGGWLATCTGLGKPAALLCALTALFALGVARLLRGERGGWIAGAAVGGAIVLHRSGLALLPAWILCLILAARRPGIRRAAWLTVTGLPVLALVLVLPQVASIVRSFDVPRHLDPATVRAHGLMGAAFAPLHLLDLFDLVATYSPALLLVPVLLFDLPGSRDREGGEWPVLGVLALSGLPILLFIHPIQGVFRDLEVFALCGFSAALLAAFLLGSGFARRRLPGTLAVSLLAAVVLSALQLLVHFHEPDAGLARARAFAVEAPARPEDEIAQLWDLIAYRAFRLQRWPAAVEASEHSVELAPHERTWTMLATAQTYDQQFVGAESTYVRLVARYPASPTAWLGLYGASLRTGDTLRVRRAADTLAAMARDPHLERQMRRHLHVFPFVVPEGAPLPFRAP